MCCWKRLWAFYVLHLKQTSPIQRCSPWERFITMKWSPKCNIFDCISWEHSWRRCSHSENATQTSGLYWSTDMDDLHDKLCELTFNRDNRLSPLPVAGIINPSRKEPLRYLIKYFSYSVITFKRHVSELRVSCHVIGQNGARGTNTYWLMSSSFSTFAKVATLFFSKYKWPGPP